MTRSRDTNCLVSEEIDPKSIEKFVFNSMFPVTAVIGNDACWTQIAREQIPMFKSRVAVDLSVGYGSGGIR